MLFVGSTPGPRPAKRSPRPGGAIDRPGAHPQFVTAVASAIRALGKPVPVVGQQPFTAE